MADKYWFGGTNTWNTTATGKWSSTSTSLVQTTVPTSADNVYFTPNSVGTITINITASVGSLTFLPGFTGTLTGSASSAINIYGNLSLTSTGVFDSKNTPTINFVNTTPATITSNGQTLGTITINCPGTSVTLNDDLITQNNTVLTLAGGTFNANGKNVTIGGFLSTGTQARTLIMNSGVWTLAFNGSPAATATISPPDLGETAWDTTAKTNLTFNAGTSKIRLIHGAVQGIGGLSAAIDSTTSTILLTDAADILTGQSTVGPWTVLIDDELISYTTLTGNTITGATRGYNNTTASSHATGNSVMLVQPSVTTLAGGSGIDNITTTISVQNASIFPADGVILIDSEQILYSSRTASVVTVAQRGYNGTTATSHAVGSRVTLINRRNFKGGGLTFNNLELNCNGAVDRTYIYGSNTFTNITTRLLSTTTTYPTQNQELYFESGTTNSFNAWTVSGRSSNLFTVRSITTGSQATLNKASSGDYWYVGINSQDVSNNTNLIFGAYSGGVDYLSFQDINATPLLNAGGVLLFF